MSKPPDWGHWRRMEQVRLGEAVCLLLKIDPDSKLAMRLLQKSAPYEFSAAERQLHTRARNMLDVAWASYNQCTLRMAVGMTVTHVAMRDWLTWARAKNYDIPEELADLVPVQGNQATHDDGNRYSGGLTWADAAYDKRLARIGCEQADDGEAPTSSETRRLSTLQRLVLAMAKAKYGWEPGEKNAATGTKAGSIHADVIEQLGESRRIDPDTIRRVLQQAADDFPGTE